jgi:hypothetical protein
MSDAKIQQIVDGVSRVARNIGTMPSDEIEVGWQRLERALTDENYPSVPIVTAPSWRWWLRGFAFAAVALVLGFSTYRLIPSRTGSPLHYVLEGATLGPSETIQAAPAAPAKLVFSDASQVRLSPSAKLSVSSLDAHGARIALADGELDVSVQHRQGTSWRFDAGPFSVQVKGTSFHLAFDADRGRLAVQMVTGVVEVRGPLDDRVLTLRAGESLELFANPAAASPGVRSPAAPPAESPSPAKAAGEMSPPPASAPVPAHAVPSGLRHRSRADERAEVEPPPALWSKLMAQGDFTAVVKDAERRGFDSTLASSSPAELTLLSDAARYTHRNDLARQALLGLRARFPGTDRARDAAFFLGRLAETPASSSGAALTWYETYLSESVQGPYAGEALGRELSLLAHTDRARARKTAQIYLERFPHGTQSELAKSLVQSASE